MAAQAMSSGRAAATVSSCPASFRPRPASNGALPSPARLALSSLSGRTHIASTAPLVAQRRRAPPRVVAASPVEASTLSAKDDSSGTEYPMVVRLWAGDEYRSLGASARQKRVVLFNVNVYALTVYVEAQKAAHELGVRYRGGFFETEQDFCDAIMDGAFGKAIQLTILRSGVGEQIADAIEEAIAPRMRLMQQTAVLDEFIGFFKQRAEDIDKAANVMIFFTQTGTVNIAVKSAAACEQTGPAVNWLGGVPEKSIESPALSREVWLGENSVVPNAKPVFAAGAKALLESENIRRQTRKGGS
eukprot:CAMPEP_0177790452 /NCGR_PEP_ID=MMETSP0491_2-20121128/23362_1 /TAXON_ID=63592 /ORGANISM="Tetraselmis chuii, Strain PLY429" /LENGTH=301 /DNA_ID=CAMNT_0019312527 /DNA_START=135 /DNA_END=1040 /DNA_ORIENTATION=+